MLAHFMTFQIPSNHFSKKNSCSILFANQIDALICVFAKKYSNVVRFLTSYVGNMATYLGLNWQTNVHKCYNN
jgi:hypothetical protein